MQVTRRALFPDSLGSQNRCTPARQLARWPWTPSGTNQQVGASAALLANTVMMYLLAASGAGTISARCASWEIALKTLCQHLTLNPHSRAHLRGGQRGGHDVCQARLLLGRPLAAAPLRAQPGLAIAVAAGLRHAPQRRANGLPALPALAHQLQQPRAVLVAPAPLLGFLSQSCCEVWGIWFHGFRDCQRCPRSATSSASRALERRGQLSSPLQRPCSASPSNQSQNTWLASGAARALIHAPTMHPGSAARAQPRAAADSHCPDLPSTHSCGRMAVLTEDIPRRRPKTLHLSRAPGNWAQGTCACRRTGQPRCGGVWQRALKP